MSKSGTKASDASTTLTKSKLAQPPSTARKQNHQPVQHKIEYYVKEELLSLYCPPIEKSLIHSIMGGDGEVEELRRAFDDLVLKPKFAHGRMIQKDEPYFRCLDCEVIKNTNQRTYICRFCFEKKSHKGHRFLLMNDATGNETCDCGNESLLDHKWFCPDHGTCHQAEFDKLLEIVPADFKKRFSQVIRQAIYELVFACEVQRSNLQGNIRNGLARMIESILAVFNHCLRFNSVFLVLLSHVLTRKFKLPTVYRHFSFIDERLAKNNPNIVEHYVNNLTYLEALMGHSLYFKEESQKELREVLLRLSCAEVFKKQLVISFHKISHTLFKVLPERPFAFSDLSHLTMQIYASEENCLKVIEECSFDNIIEVIRCYTKNYEPSLDVGGKVLTRLLHLFELILEKEYPGKHLVKKEGVVTKFLDVVADFQKNSSYSVKNLSNDLKFSNTEQNILDYWEFERRIFTITERLAKNIGNILDTEGWDRHPELFLIDWGERATEDSLINPVDSAKAHLNLPLQRSIIAYLQYSLDGLEPEKLIARLEYIRRSSPDGIVHLLKQSLATIGLMRQTMIKIDGWNVSKNRVVERYFSQEDGLSYFDYDFTFVQLFSLLISEEELNVFELYYKSFFSGDEELIKLFETGNFKKATDDQVKIVEDFLMFMVQLLHGEISFFNVFYRGPYLTGHGSKKVLDQIHRKILITFLHKTYQYFPIKTLKHDFRYILRGDIFHEKILKDIADIEKSSKNFKLKKAYSSLFDSFYLYSDRIINNKLVSNVRYNNRKPEIAELGNFTQSLQFLIGLQQRFYESFIVEWFSKFFDNYTKNASNLLPSIIKLIILPLKLLEHNKKNQLSSRFKERIVFPFFGSNEFLEKMKKVLPKVEDPTVLSILAKLVNIFVPKSNIGNMSNTSFNIEPEDLKAFLDVNMSMDPSNLPDLMNQTLMSQPQTRDWDEKEQLCGICCKKVDLTSVDVGIPGFISKSNMNYWELKGRKFRKPPHSADKDTLKLIVYLVRHRYNPYAGGLNAKEFDWMEGYVPPNMLMDFYPAFNSCMHYLHRSCYSKTFVPVAGSAREFECPVCKKLNNMFIGMEKVDAASRKLIEEQLKKNKRFLNFIKKQGVILSMLPDPNLKFDFYNSFMMSLFPKNPSLELKLNDAAADKKILKFANLIRASYFQLVRNSLINDFETFMAKSYMCYKFAFVNLQSFIMKNFQFHQYFENYNQELPPTIFHILNHSALMGSPEPPSMQQLYDVYSEVLGIDFEKKKIKAREEKEKRKQKEADHKHLGEHQHEHHRRLPEVPSGFRKKLYGAVEMNSKNKQIMDVYNLKARLVKVNDTLFEDNQMVTHDGSQIGSQIDIENQINGSMDSFDGGRSIGSAPEETDEIKEEDLFDILQKMMLLFENETEEDFLLAFWETFLRFLTTNRMKDHHTNIDLEKIPLDFLYLRTLAIFSRTLLSERVIQMKQPNIPDFEEICQLIAGRADLRDSFIEEMIGLVQRIVVACILMFDFDKCQEITNALEFLSELKTNRENFLNHLLGFLQKGLTVDVILSAKMWDISSVYKNFFYTWRENLAEFLKKTKNPFELAHKNIVEIKPLVVSLPSNFNEFNSEYLPRKCDQCGEFCNYCQTVLCLLCGKVFCKDKCQKKAHKKIMLLEGTEMVNIDTMNSQPTQESEDPMEVDERSMSIENDTPLVVTRKSSAAALALAKKGLTKGNQKPSAPNLSRPNNLKANTLIPKNKKSNIDILTFDDNLNAEQGNARNGKLSPVFDPKSLVTPIKNYKIPSSIDVGNDWDKLSSVRGSSPKNLVAKPFKSSTTTAKKSPPRGRQFNLDTKVDPKSAKAKSSGKFAKDLSPKFKENTNKFTIKKTNPLKSKMPKPESKLDQTNVTDGSRDDSVDSQGKKKKKKKRVKRGNMHKHAEECHKGHTVYIGIQDQSVIMFSKLREVVYPEKLYVDRFGQELKDKVNIVEEDWNFFELNPFVLKRLREAVENHSLPQLIYSIMKNHFKPSTK